MLPRETLALSNNVNNHFAEMIASTARGYCRASAARRAFVIDDFTAILKRKLAFLTLMMRAFVLFACQPIVHHSGRVCLRSPFSLGLLAIAAGPDLPRPLSPLLLD